jgi:hypothetical protein
VVLASGMVTFKTFSDEHEEELVSYINTSTVY